MAGPQEAVLLGAGGRGYQSLAGFAQRHPDELRIVAVAEPDPERLARCATTHAIPPERQFRTWEDLIASGQLAPGLINATMDQMHLASTTAALAAGYHVLCEKPMATTPHDCVRLVRAAERHQRQLQICHVLRYAPFWSGIKQVLDSGRLGDLYQIMHTENVAWWHQAHSFVRGNWGNSEQAAPMVLAKSCHDMDQLVWQVGRPCRRLSSFGSLTHFRPEQAPAGAGERCLDCEVEPDCTYSAVRQYLGEQTSWPVSAISVDSSLEARRRAVETGPYGRCVYRCNNDVVDHQVAILEFDGGLTATFTMHGFSHENTRTVRYGGSQGTLRGHDVHHQLTLYQYHPGSEETIDLDRLEGGHSGGDTGLMRDFCATLADPGREVLTTARNSLESHLICFAAEESRLTGRVIDMDSYRERIEAEVAASEVEASV